MCDDEEDLMRLHTPYHSNAKCVRKKGHSSTEFWLCTHTTDDVTIAQQQHQQQDTHMLVCLQSFQHG